MFFFSRIVNILPRYPQKNFAARHKESLSQKVGGDCAEDLLYAPKAMSRKKRFLPNAGFTSAPEGLGGARGLVFYKTRIAAC